MQIRRCMNCMAETDTYPCPACGYVPESQKQMSSALPEGTILNGRYLIGRAIGRGGFGMTYVGLDLSLERKVAIKEYFPSGQAMRSGSTGGRSDSSTLALIWSDTEQANLARRDGMQGFLKEARKMAKLQSIPNVVNVTAVFQENETAYIVMEFAEGETLKAILKRKGTMDWEEAKPVFLSAIRTMSQVHAAGMVHRDLSPDNLMLAPDGSVRILDLGAAKDLNLNTGASSALVAKTGFSPLEQYSERGGSGPWSDVYAMAATIYYALTGVVPQASFNRVAEDELDWKHPGLAAVPSHVIAALQHAMEIRAKDRTQDMPSFLRELETGRTLPQVSAAVVPIQELQPGTTVHEDGDHSSRQASKQKNYLLPILLAAAFILIAAVLMLLFGKSNCWFGHSYSDWLVTEQAGCTTQGTEQRKCSACGAVESRNLTAAGSHNYGQWTVVREATCAAAGSRQHICSSCGRTEEEELARLAEHSFGVWKTTREATCASEGTRQRSCSVCGNTEEESIPGTDVHNYGAWKTVTAATCTSEGREERCCEICGRVESRALDRAAVHSYGDWYTSSYATCGENGSEKRECSICGHQEERTVPKTGNHNYGSWRTTTAATCGAEGREERSCSVCGVTESRTLAKTGSHNYGSWSTEKEATTTETGLERRFCVVCGDKQTRNTDKLQPSYVFINDLPGLQSFSRHGKLWFHTAGSVSFNHNEQSWITDVTGIITPPRDSQGNTYTYGLHLDGTDTGPYYINVPLNGAYTTFTCTVSCASIAGSGSSTVAFYVDNMFVKGVPMYYGADPVQVSLPISGKSTLRIEYSYASSSNDHAVIYDGQLHS